MEIQPTPVNVGATTSVAGADEGKSCEDDGTSPSLPASESHVVVPTDTTSRQEAKVEKKPSKQSIPFTKRGQAKARSGRRKTRRSRSRSPIKDRRRDKSPWGTELSTDESSSDVDDFSFDSDLAATLTHKTITPENLPLPEGDDGNLLDPQTDNSNTDTFFIGTCCRCRYLPIFPIGSQLCFSMTSSSIHARAGSWCLEIERFAAEG